GLLRVREVESGRQPAQEAQEAEPAQVRAAEPPPVVHPAALPQLPAGWLVVAADHVVASDDQFQLADVHVHAEPVPAVQQHDPEYRRVQCRGQRPGLRRGAGQEGLGRLDTDQGGGGLPGRLLLARQDSRARSQAMSVAGSGVSQISGAPAARTTSRISAGSIWPDSRPACRSRPEPNSSRELLQWTRSMRPVMALTRSTTVARSSPAACAWQVSRQKPTSPPPSAASAMVSHSRAMFSRLRAIAPSPPAVFSISMGSGRSIRSIALRQLS